MKLVAKPTTPAADGYHLIRDTRLEEFPKSVQLHGDLHLHTKPEGNLRHLLVADAKRILAVVTVKPDRLRSAPYPVDGVTVLASVHLKNPSLKGYLSKVIAKLAGSGVVFAPVQVTKVAAQAWAKRIKTDTKHVYLAFNPKGFNQLEGAPVMMVLRSATLAQRLKFVLDGSPDTRLLVCSPNHEVLKKYGIDVRNG